MPAQILVELGDHPTLELSTARLLYTVQNSGSGGVAFGAGVQVSTLSDTPQDDPVDEMDTRSMGLQQQQQQQLDGDSLQLQHWEGISPTTYLSPEQERGACRWVIQLCETEICTSEMLAKAGALAAENDAEALSGAEEWMHRRHVLLASTYCQQRTDILRVVMQDLEAQLLFLGD